ncbi:hypothetical protein V493_03188 [Pseudogymnoascus sp. VKM F-4281 (FW-2241)]|nr:hypothetical protein V493_03188 [Pseudogymnoascus sp. VKM F-4281 (FW-2241)]
MGHTMKAPPPAAGGHVYPLHMFDDTKQVRKMIMPWTFRFDAPLDAEKLRDALARLLDTGDWRKLAGRLHFTKAGRLEIHVPETFTDECPRFTYTHNDRSAVAIDEDELGHRFPKSLKKACVYGSVPEFIQYAMPPGAPKSIEEYVRRRVPQLALVITSFKDTTLIGLSWPHTLMDGVGQKELLAAWSLALAGREQNIPQLLGAREDVAWDIAGQFTEDGLEKDAFGDRLLKGLNRYIFISKLVWNNLASGATETRTFYLPRDFVEQQRQAAIGLLPNDTDTERPPFLSDGDVVCAWFVKMVSSTRPKPAQFVVAGAVNARDKVPQIRKANGVYVQNLLSLYFVQISADQAAGPLAHIALAHRRQVAEQSTEHQLIHHFMKKRREADSKKSGDKLMLYCHQDDLLIMSNNLSRIGIAEAADFGPAVLPNEDGSRSPGKAVYYHFQSSLGSGVGSGVPSFYVYSKDDSGYWIRANASRRTWDKIMEEIGVSDVQ